MAIIPNNWITNCLTLAILLTMVPGCHSAAYLGVTLTDTKASETTDYTFDVLSEDELTIPAGSDIVITYPIQYQ